MVRFDPIGSDKRAMGKRDIFAPAPYRLIVMPPPCQEQSLKLCRHSGERSLSRPCRDLPRGDHQCLPRFHRNGQQTRSSFAPACEAREKGRPNGRPFDADCDLGRTMRASLTTQRARPARHQNTAMYFSSETMPIKTTIIWMICFILASTGRRATR